MLASDEAESEDTSAFGTSTAEGDVAALGVIGGSDTNEARETDDDDTADCWGTSTGIGGGNHGTSWDPGSVLEEESVIANDVKLAEPGPSGGVAARADDNEVDEYTANHSSLLTLLLNESSDFDHGVFLVSNSNTYIYMP